MDGQGSGSTNASTVDCGTDSGAPSLRVKFTPTTKIKIGVNKLTVTATSSQFAVSTFKVIQGGKVLSRKVFVLTPGKKLKAKLKLLGSAKLAKGPATLQVSTFSVDGVRVKMTKQLNVK